MDRHGEDAELQREFVEDAVEAARTGRVPGCWLGLEGDGADTRESPHGGSEQDERLPGEDWEPPQGWVREPEMSDHRRVEWWGPEDRLARASAAHRELLLTAAAKPPMR